MQGVDARRRTSKSRSWLMRAEGDLLDLRGEGKLDSEDGNMLLRGVQPPPVAGERG